MRCKTNVMSCSACRGFKGNLMIQFIQGLGVRAVPALISFVILLFFIVPLFVGIVNLGNIAGILLSSVILAFSLFYNSVSGYISKLWKFPLGKAGILLASFIIVSGIIITVTISVFMLKTLSDKPESNNTTVIVLGCQVKETRPSLMLKRRLDAAFEYLSENDNVNVIVSGGKGSDEKISEAQCMKEYLINKGIQSERIIMEDKSSSTYENLKFSKQIIEKRNLPADITIVTDGYHQLRAEMIAKSLDYKNISNISAPTSPWLVPTYWLREWFGVSYQYLFGK